MAHILFLSQLVPYPPDAGPKVRSYFTLRYLAQKHQITLLAFSRQDDRADAIAHLEEFCTAVNTVPMRRSFWRNFIKLLQSVASGKSWIILRDWVPEFADRMAQLISNTEQPINAIHADQLWMAQYALQAVSHLPPAHRPRLILDEHNACFQIFQRLANNERNPLKRILLEREWRALRRFEAQACSEFDRVVTVTNEDRAILEDTIRGEEAGDKSRKSPLSPNPSPLFSTIPICVDTRSVQPVVFKPESKNVLHLGTMFWPPNIQGVLWFAREAWPQVATRVPGATFIVVGKNPPAEILQLGESALPVPGSVRVTGYVPDPRPYLENAAVFIVPLFSAGGMRVKIVDAWRWSLPVVSTSIGAEGIDYRDGENILIADGAEAFAQAVVRILNDRQLAEHLRLNGRRWVEEHYDWQKVYPAWDEIFQNADGTLSHIT